MKVELTAGELHNVRACIRREMKQPEYDEEAMKMLLALSDKFVEPKVEEIKVVNGEEKPV
jgi:hypothetical protein